MEENRRPPEEPPPKPEHPAGEQKPPAKRGRPRKKPASEPERPAEEQGHFEERELASATPEKDIPRKTLDSKKLLRTASEAQLEANRKNSEKSTGPKRPEGKEKVSKNALKHGILSKHLYVQELEIEEFNLVAEEMRKSLDPKGALEELLVDRIVSLSWRIRTLMRIEATAIRSASPRWENWTDQKFFRDLDDSIIAEDWLATRKEVREAFDILTDDDARKLFLRLCMRVRQMRGEIPVERTLIPLPKDTTGESTLDEMASEIPDPDLPWAIRQLKDKLMKSTRIWYGWNPAIGLYISPDDPDEEDLPKVFFEAELLKVVDSGRLDKVMRYEAALERGLFRAIRLLERVQNIRKGVHVEPDREVNVNLTMPRE